VAVVGPWTRPGLPQLGKSVQITSDEREKGRLAVGGDALLFESVGGLRTITRIDQGGRRQSLLPFMQGDFRLQDVSLDGSELLVVAEGPQEIDGPLWVIPSDGGPPRRLADLRASTAAWSPDGRQLAYVTPARELCLAGSGGSNRRKLTTLPFRANQLRWSPDARRLRLVLSDPPLSPDRLWEVSVDGSGLRRLLPGWSRAAYDEGKRWPLVARWKILRFRGISQRQLRPLGNSRKKRLAGLERSRPFPTNRESQWRLGPGPEPGWKAVVCNRDGAGARRLDALRSRHPELC
jgi:hypothetical protein